MLTEGDMKITPENLKGSIKCAATLLEYVGDIEITIKENLDLLTAYSWLETLHTNMFNELGKIDPEFNKKPDTQDAGTVSDPTMEDDGGTD